MPASQSAKSARLQAWELVNKENKGKSADEISQIWIKKLDEIFPGKSSKSLTDAEWNKFLAHLKNPVPPAPLLDAATFTEDDIPF